MKCLTQRYPLLPLLHSFLPTFLYLIPTPLMQMMHIVSESFIAYFFIPRFLLNHVPIKFFKDVKCAFGEFVAYMEDILDHRQKELDTDVPTPPHTHTAPAMPRSLSRVACLRVARRGGALRRINAATCSGVTRFALLRVQEETKSAEELRETQDDLLSLLLKVNHVLAHSLTTYPLTCSRWTLPFIELCGACVCFFAMPAF